MTFIRIPCLATAAALLLAGCAKASLFNGGESGSEPADRGIQTSAMRGAPEAREAQNESRPLSELNTPDAIAAREAQARSVAPAGRAVAASAAPVPTDSATAAAEAALKASDPHQQNAALQKGAKVRVRSDAGLRARPNTSSDSVPVPPGTLPELGPQVYNASGYWWYVTAGKESGWLSQSDILP